MITESIPTDEKREALEQVFRSQTFARADRLRALLRYICEAEIGGRIESVTEYVIGVEALGRPEGYSPAEDSSVRSRVYELRQKLDRYYHSEALDAAVRIDLPKGSYIPRFVRPAVSTPEPVVLPTTSVVAPVADIDVAPVPVAPPQRHRLSQWGFVAAFLGGGLLVYGVLALTVGVGPSRQISSAAEAGGAGEYRWTPELEAIWKPFLDPATPVLISFQTRLFLNIGSLAVRDSKVDSLAELESSKLVMKAKEAFASPQLYENRNYTDFGSANACLLLGRLFGSRSTNVSARRSADVHWDDLKRNNVIILGKPTSDPDVARLLPTDYFVEVGGKIRNLQPQPGEMPEWEDHNHPSDPSRNWTEKYGLITLLPAPVPNRWILSMAGSGSEHPWALAEFLTNAESAKELVKRLRGTSGEMPRSWQVVIRADFKTQSPVRVSYVAHRVLNGR